jgi:hypothetical protein
MAAVSGTVINRSTGQPQAGATVGLDRVSQNGMERIGEAKTDAQGKFTIDQKIEGPNLLRAEYQGVSYYHMVAPGSPTTGITVDIYNASKEPGEAKVSKHMLMFEPGSGKMTVEETFLCENTGKTAWHDSTRGTLQFYLPAGAEGKAQVSATAPGGMPIAAGVLKTSKPDVFAVDFPIKPGETRFDINYSLPYVRSAPYEGKIVSNDQNTYLIAPNGVELKGDGLNDLGTEPRTQAHIYGLAAKSYKIELTGEVAPAAPAADSASGDDSGPQIQQIMPRIFTQAPLILGLALGILALGFVLLYRAPVGAPKESNERGRR